MKGAVKQVFVWFYQRSLIVKSEFFIPTHTKCLLGCLIVRFSLYYVGSLTSNIKYIEVTAVEIWSHINKTEFKYNYIYLN